MSDWIKIELLVVIVELTNNRNQNTANAKNIINKHNNKARHLGSWRNKPRLCWFARTRIAVTKIFKQANDRETKTDSYPLPLWWYHLFSPTGRLVVPPNLNSVCIWTPFSFSSSTITSTYIFCLWKNVLIPTTVKVLGLSFYGNR